MIREGINNEEYNFFGFLDELDHFEAIKNIGYNSVSANRARLTVTGVQLKYLVFLLSSNNNNRSDNDCLTKINCLAKTFILTRYHELMQYRQSQNLRLYLL